MVPTCSKAPTLRPLLLQHAVRQPADSAKARRSCSAAHHARLSPKASPASPSRAQGCRASRACCYPVSVPFCETNTAAFCLHDVQICTFVWVDNLCKTSPAIVHKVWHFSNGLRPCSSACFPFPLLRASSGHGLGHAASPLHGHLDFLTVLLNSAFS